jgi:hypothetical protein
MGPINLNCINNTTNKRKTPPLKHPKNRKEKKKKRNTFALCVGRAANVGTPKPHLLLDTKTGFCGGFDIYLGGSVVVGGGGGGRVPAGG